MLSQAHHSATSSYSSSKVQPASNRPANGLSDLFAAEPSRLLRSGETLFAQGDFKTNVYMVESGSVLICRLRADGARQIVRFVFAGDFIGLESGDEYFCEAQALAQTRVRSLPHARLLSHAARDPLLAREILDALSHDISDSHEHLFTVGRLSATARIASFLLLLARRNERKGLSAETVTLPGRRCDMADFLCMSVETVSRALTELKGANAISLKGWRLIEIHNSSMLEMLASAQTSS